MFFKCFFRKKEGCGLTVVASGMIMFSNFRYYLFITLDFYIIDFGIVLFDIEQMYFMIFKMVLTFKL